VSGTYQRGEIRACPTCGHAKAEPGAITLVRDGDEQVIRGKIADVFNDMIRDMIRRREFGGRC
jgi:hypothetical protein